MILTQGMKYGTPFCLSCSMLANDVVFVDSASRTYQAQHLFRWIEESVARRTNQGQRHDMRPRPLPMFGTHVLPPASRRQEPMLHW